MWPPYVLVNATSGWQSQFPSHKLSGHLVRVWEDNAEAEGSIARNESKVNDHNLMVHNIWLWPPNMVSALGGTFMF